MTDLVQLVSIVISAALLVTIIELVRRGRLSEEYSFIWIVCAIALFALSVWRNLLDLAASALGVHYPPAVLLLVLTFFVVIVSLAPSIRRMIPSRPAEKSARPSALQARAKTGPSCHRTIRTMRPISGCQMRTVPSPEALSTTMIRRLG
jgi:hypothetical protein